MKEMHLSSSALLECTRGIVEEAVDLEKVLHHLHGTGVRRGRGTTCTVQTWLWREDVRRCVV
jgi:hypothetical protein